MNSKILGGILLIAGTSIGTGILAIPSDTAEAGFGWSIVLFLICWVFSTLGALYYMEVHLWQKSPTANLLSITEYFFGPRIKALIWIIYLALLYSLMCTYLLAGSSWIIQSVGYLAHISLGQITGMLIFIGLIGLFIFFGIRVVDHVNRIMLFGLALTYILILMFSLPKVQPALLAQPAQDILNLPKAIPLLITAFGYSIIVPSLSTYFNRDVKMLRQAILIGSIVTLIIYVFWEIATLGNIPLEGSHGLRAIAHGLDNGTQVANALINVAQNVYLTDILTMFALFAVITSFLGVSMALYHALADGLQINANGLKGVFLLLLTYIPPMLFLLIIPTGFNQILSWAGVLVAFLMGVLPMMMILKGRYIIKLKGYRVPGGIWVVSLVLLFFFSVMLAELLNK
ncbi:MAG: tyrosine transporter [Gammaproteobacteria bacterium]|nr:tyrosine transporter [Gammaproteobacteria bacterium]